MKKLYCLYISLSIFNLVSSQLLDSNSEFIDSKPIKGLAQDINDSIIITHSIPYYSNVQLIRKMINPKVIHELRKATKDTIIIINLDCQYIYIRFNDVWKCFNDSGIMDECGRIKKKHINKRDKKDDVQYIPRNVGYRYEYSSWYFYGYVFNLKKLREFKIIYYDRKPVSKGPTDICKSCGLSSK